MEEMEAGLGESILNWEKIGNLKADRGGRSGCCKNEGSATQKLVFTNPSLIHGYLI